MNQWPVTMSKLSLHVCFCPTHTCVQFPPVDLAEEGVFPELITRSVPEAESFVDLFDEQTLADGPGLLTELLWIRYGVIQDPLLHHLVLHLETTQNSRDEFELLI